MRALTAPNAGKQQAPAMPGIKPVRPKPGTWAEHSICGEGGKKRPRPGVVDEVAGTAFPYMVNYSLTPPAYLIMNGSALRWPLYHVPVNSLSWMELPIV